MKIEIGDKEYNVTVVSDEEDKRRGLQDTDHLDSNEGMLFIYDKPQTVHF
jgi:uncharacterized membrane protein (UPF0127 family)